MDIIEINDTNYQSYTHIPIVAFSFAHGGAMGEPGGIIIIDSEGQAYHANYVYGDDHLDPSHIEDVIPVFSHLSFSLLGCQTENTDWEYVALGFGNNLLVRKDLSDRFNKAVEEAHFEYAGQLYQRWKGIVMSLLGVSRCKQ
jgi:hypothetical protein